MRSKELNTYVHVDTDNQRAYVIVDSLSMPHDIIDQSVWIENYKPVDLNGEGYFQSEPIPLAKAGSISKILEGNPTIMVTGCLSKNMDIKYLLLNF